MVWRHNVGALILRAVPMPTFPFNPPYRSGENTTLQLMFYLWTLLKLLIQSTTNSCGRYSERQQRKFYIL
eukprot:13850876-Ditylum_brightwellii.AAC.1